MTTPAALVPALVAAAPTSSSEAAASLAITETSSSRATRPDGIGYGAFAAAGSARCAAPRPIPQGQPSELHRQPDVAREDAVAVLDQDGIAGGAELGLHVVVHLAHAGRERAFLHGQ